MVVRGRHISAPDVALAAIASRTTRMRLLSAVTVLGSDDPIRVFQPFSTVDAASTGRAEAILGRGSFTESFPLFGFGLDDYETLLEEELDLFATIAAHDGKSEPVSWTGTTGVRLECCARRGTGCRSCSRSSAATRGDSPHTSRCITRRSRSSVVPCYRSACTRRDASPNRMRRRVRSCGPHLRGPDLGIRTLPAC